MGSGRWSATRLDGKDKSFKAATYICSSQRRVTDRVADTIKWQQALECRFGCTRQVQMDVVVPRDGKRRGHVTVTVDAKTFRGR